MSSCRETGNIWFYLSGRWGGKGSWRGWRLFKRRFWRNRYIWHDTCGKFFYRFFVCPWRGHGFTRAVNDPGDPLRVHCFHCECDIYPLRSN